MAAREVISVPTKTPYLHPSEKRLKSEQIGPSSHKNVYHAGVLTGNWIEERAGFGQIPVSVPLETTTINKLSFQHPGRSRRQEPTPHTDVERALLFGHGQDFHCQTFETTNELFFTHPEARTGPPRLSASMKSASSTTSSRGLPAVPEAGYSGGGPGSPSSAMGSTATGSSSRRSELTEKKKAQWEGERDVKQRFTTTKGSTIDASGKLAQANPELAYTTTHVTPGQRLCLQSLNQDYHKLELRAPIALSQSPLC